MMPLPRIYRLLLTAIALPLFLLAAQGPALAAIDCFSCHERAAFQKRIKHQPATAGECSTCHSPHVARYPGLLQQTVQKLCAQIF